MTKLERVAKALDRGEWIVDGVVVHGALWFGLLAAMGDDFSAATCFWALGAFYRVAFHRHANREAVIHLHNKTGMDIDMEQAD